MTFTTVKMPLKKSRFSSSGSVPNLQKAFKTQTEITVALYARQVSIYEGEVTVRWEKD